MTLAEYLQFLDWTGREVRRDGKSSRTPPELRAVRDRVGVSPELCVDCVKRFQDVRLRSRPACFDQQWQAKLNRDGNSDNQRARGIRILRNALNIAVKLRKIPFNPMGAVDIPHVERAEIEPLERDVCFQIFDVAEEHRIGDIVPLAIMTGPRMREIFALDWSAVNLREGVLSVRKSLEEISRKTIKAVGAKATLNEKPTKTRKSKRVVTLEPIAVQASTTTGTR